VDKGTDLDSFPDIKEADSLRSVQLVPAGAEHIDMTFIHIDRQLAISLYCVRMEQDIVSGRDFTDFLNGLDCANFIIGKHDGNQDSVRPDGFFQLVQLYYTIFVHIYISNFTALLLQIFTGMENGVMLYFGRDDMLSFGCIGLRSSFQRPVVRFRASGREINFIAGSAQGTGYDILRLAHGLLALRAQGINAAGVPVVLREPGKHGLYHLRRGFRGCRIIQINQFIHYSTLLSA